MCLFPGVFPLLEGRPVLHGRERDGQGHDNRSHQLQPLYRHNFCIQYNRVDKTIDNRTNHSRQRAFTTLLRPSTVSPMIRQARPMTTIPGAAVDVGSILILAHHGAGESRQRIGHAQAYGDGKGRIYRRSTHHIDITPVARMERPSRVPRNSTSSTPARITTVPASSTSTTVRRCRSAGTG